MCVSIMRIKDADQVVISLDFPTCPHHDSKQSHLLICGGGFIYAVRGGGICRVAARGFFRNIFRKAS